MSTSSLRCLIVGIVFTLGAASSQAVIITYASSTDGVSRPVSFTDLTVGTTQYNVNVTYLIDGAANRIRVGDLPDAMITPAATAMANALNALSADDAFVTSIVLQPNVDTITLGSGQFQFNNSVDDFTTNGEDDWTIWTTDDPSQGYSQFGSGTTLTTVGFATFTAVPEPGAASCLGLCFVAYGFAHRMRKWLAFAQV